MRRPKASPSVETLRKLAEGLQTTPEWLAFGDGEHGLLEDFAREEERPLQLRMARVAGFVQAGLWYDGSVPPQINHEPIPYVPTRYANIEQLAYRVAGPSMNLKGINDGDFVLAVQYWQVRTAPQDGDIVIVERRRDNGEVERTVKEVVVRPQTIELTPRSTDPAYQDPIVIERNHAAEDYAQVEIIALVIGAYRSFY